MAIYVLIWGRPLERLVDVRHQTWVFFLRILVKIAALYWLDLRVIASQQVPMALAIRHGSVNAALRPTDKSAGSDGACK